MGTNNTINLMREMAIFAKVVETGSFSETARQLAATPSAISRSVARLEKALGTRLLQRTTRKLRLSEGGKKVYVHCLEMLSAAQEVMAISGNFSPEPQGLVRVSVPKAIGRFVVHPHIPDFLEHYPKVDVNLRLDDRYVDLIDDHVDLAIRITNQPPSGLMGRRLLNIWHMLCATPEYLAKHGTPQHPNDLKAHSCIYLGEEPGDSRWKFAQGNKIATVNIHGRYAANHTGVRLDAVLQHIGIGSLPYFTAKHALQQGQLVQVLPDWSFKANYSGELWILYPPTRHLPPKLRVFIEFLAERLHQEVILDKSADKHYTVQPYELPEVGKATK
ncbi:LysR family transcriptional regulator [Xenorhabdus mauleonii]|uniref:DNA-binding transcriptional regulator, LysR family n=1 Tax=Xenorhabdus mauleonii TaxID=351675 RepID=A0A1I3VL22_9GAMM|nr:LysR family transcriptional regulator [Xenorhabdus mauleonii]PHM37412.1 LysR family transcriptional regulator [Xenorhabdus mauleonii]SFJ95890.1 DNA-binding transcriptional regulator, LysR family [Xenorhabdus mauleonii]